MTIDVGKTYIVSKGEISLDIPINLDIVSVVYITSENNYAVKTLYGEILGLTKEVFIEEIDEVYANTFNYNSLRLYILDKYPDLFL